MTTKKKQIVYVAEMDNLFGYDCRAVATTEKKAIAAVKRGVIDFLKQRIKSETPLDEFNYNGTYFKSYKAVLDFYGVNVWKYTLDGEAEWQ